MASKTCFKLGERSQTFNISWRNPHPVSCCGSFEEGLQASTTASIVSEISAVMTNFEFSKESWIRNKCWRWPCFYSGGRIFGKKLQSLATVTNCLKSSATICYKIWGKWLELVTAVEEAHALLSVIQRLKQERQPPASDKNGFEPWEFFKKCIDF